MGLFFGEFPNAIGESERLHEIVELEGTFQVVFVDYDPVFVNLLQEPSDFGSPERRSPFLARDTFAVGEVTHDFNLPPSLRMRAFEAAQEQIGHWDIS